jgi:hypothetical protein
VGEISVLAISRLRKTKRADSTSAILLILDSILTNLHLKYSNSYILVYYKWCPYKTSGDKTSVGTKRPWGQNVRGDKTSVGQNIRGDKRSVGQKVRRTERPWGQNVCGDKTSVGTKRPWTKRPWTKRLSGSYLPGPCEAIFLTQTIFFTGKSTEGVGKILNNQANIA